jgi:hypothetical protein
LLVIAEYCCKQPLAAAPRQGAMHRIAARSIGPQHTSGSVGLSPACMCGNGYMSIITCMDGGFQAVRAAGENLQIRTLFYKNKYVFY